MKRILIILLIVLAPFSLLALRPGPVCHPRPQCYHRFFQYATATETATVIATETETPIQAESAHVDIGAMSDSINTPSPTPQIAGARMCLWFTYATGCVAWATVTPVVVVGLSPIPPTVAAPPPGYPDPPTPYRPTLTALCHCLPYPPTATAPPPGYP